MNRKIFYIALVTLIIDQVTKIIVSFFLRANEQISIIKNFFSIHYIENNGAAWSLLTGRVEFLILISLIVLFVIYRYMYNFKKNNRNNLAFGFILGGILGNLLDRIFLGYVKDFLSFNIFQYHYPIFNFADVFIVIGTVLLIFAVFKGEDKNETNQSK